MHSCSLLGSFPSARYTSGLLFRLTQGQLIQIGALSVINVLKTHTTHIILFWLIAAIFQSPLLVIKYGMLNWVRRM